MRRAVWGGRRGSSVEVELSGACDRGLARHCRGEGVWNKARMACVGVSLFVEHAGANTECRVLLCGAVCSCATLDGVVCRWNKH